MKKKSRTCLPKYDTGGKILAGGMGLLGGALGAVPGVGGILQGGVDMLHNRLDADIRPEEEQFGNIGSAVGGIGANLITGGAGMFMRNGGPVNPGYEAEGGEVVDGGIPTAFNGGNVSPNSATSAKLNGASHEQGGMAMAGGERVFSDSLKVGGKGSKTYAQEADKLTKKIGKLEKGMKSSDRFAKNTAKQMLPRLNQELDSLFNAQEASKLEAYNKDMEKLSLKYGGEIPGGPGKERRKARREAAGETDFSAQDTLNVKDSSAIPANFVNTSYTHDMRADAKKEYRRRPVDVLRNAVGVEPRTRLMFEDGGMLPKYNLGGGVVPTMEEFLQSRPDLANMPQETIMQVYQRTIGNPSSDDMEVQYNQTDGGPRGTSVYRSELADTYGKDKDNVLKRATPRSGDPSYTASPLGLQTAGIPEMPEDLTKNTRLNDVNFLDKARGAVGKAKGFADENDLFYKGAMYAPTIYNAVRGMQKPQELNQEDFQNPYESKAFDLMKGRRYDIDPQLQSNRSSFNNIRKNMRNATGGNAGAYLSNLGAAQMNMDKSNAQAYSTKNNMDNQYLGQEAGMYANLGNARAQRKFQIQDVNDRNKAARDGYQNAAVTGLSSLAQSGKRDANRASADDIRVNTLDALYSNYGYQLDEKGRPTGKLNYRD